ncbi:YifB family Mg chelatase-like AAA ATPase [Candidatus Saccharibacteria bacterium]|nr:YifB family Mg chelatase-like AAA ATPase [Candidatus Saccharibacteria bacterium]
MSAKRSISSLVEGGHGGLVVEVECQLSRSLPGIIIVGYANKAVDEAKERIRNAFIASNVTLPAQRITVNLAPADIPKDGTSFDLAIAAAIIRAIGQGDKIPSHCAIMGELGLEGTVRPIRGVIGKLLAGKSHGYTTFIIPEANIKQARLVPGIRLVPIGELRELAALLRGDLSPDVIVTDEIPENLMSKEQGETAVMLEDIIGQELGKRAIEIAAAGGHNVLLGGPPGTGKSMLAQVLPTLLAPMTRDEMLEVTHLHSLASNNFEEIIQSRPFRSPHHSASNVAIVGGGNNIRPGEMSLAHRGVLLFDELPEFSRQTVEALRQPLENRSVTIARARETAEYPAHFIFVGTANPCPCGHFGTAKPCRCMPHAVIAYRRKLSGPILDRIDIYVDVHEIDNSRLLTEKASTTGTSKLVREKVIHAQVRQSRRFGNSSKRNADMTNREVKSLVCLEPEAKTMLDLAAEKFSLSARAYMRTVKLARTIADLDDCDTVRTKHVAEALQYRPHQFHDA